MRRFAIVVPADARGRLDRFLAGLDELGLSRSRLHRLIAEGLVTVDGTPCKPAFGVEPGQMVEVVVPDPEPSRLEPEEIPLDIVYEDTDLLVVNKPRGLVVHPGAGNPRGTLVNAVLKRCPDLGAVGDVIRPGIVHRLDKDTTGLLVVAKNQETLTALQAQLKDRRLARRYLAVVAGDIPGDEGEVDAPVGRHPVHRQRMAVVRTGRPALTRWRVQERFGGATMLEALLVTGRTHQVRVHMAHLGHPVLGDRLYGGQRACPAHLPLPAGQALHAWRLQFRHPRTGDPVDLTADPPADFRRLLEALRERGSCPS
ncbi:MAG: RluA family pseudouridine synthase [Bacillota bacterium]|nr:RluA family pseudouridine synthase [Bacillota bacterium]